MFTYRTDSPYPTLPRVRVVVEPLPADDHTSPSQVTATTLPLKEWAEDWYPIPSPLPAVSGERPDRTPKPLPVTTRTQLLGQIQQQAEAWCAVAQALDKHFPKWNPWCGRSGTENAVLCIEQAAADLARLQSELAGVKEEAVGHAKEVLRMVPVINALMDWDDTISKYDAAAMQAHVATALRDYRTALLSSRPVAGNEVES